MNKKRILPIIGVTLLSGSLLGCQTPVQADASNPVNIKASQDVKPDQKLMQQAQNKLKELTGNTYTLTQGTGMKGFVNFQREGFKKDSISYKEANGKLDSLNININYEDLNGGKYQTKLKETWKALFPGEEPKHVDISESIYRVGTISSNAKQNKQVFMEDNGKVFGVNYAPDKAPASVQKKATQVISNLTNGKIKKGEKLDRVFVVDGKPNVYKYKYTSKTMTVTFAIEDETLELLHTGAFDSSGKSVASYDEFQKKEKSKDEKIKKLTLDTLTKNATRDAKKMLNLDLKGYKGTRGTNAWDNNILTFTKKGAPTVTATVDSNGSFTEFTVEKYGLQLSYGGLVIVGAPNEDPKILIN
ncbi:hypothetical protein PAECIP112173_02749 [Paenibacillus sp. JJ-100]|uniref:hypothetical protein n=1 Tax=Paenibacillus sp. JJ-100 TaxID=2974896 RepID=UPI0022FF7DCB|nr:hypothetical protein [Paenibacillus sp. JJ-100]CAI6079932.1 hypothetical protein PAECIP112173_02749 [Paenibacillus sp. JJ-100]